MAAVRTEQRCDGSAVEIFLVSTGEVFLEATEIDFHFIYIIIGLITSMATHWGYKK